MPISYLRKKLNDIAIIHRLYLISALLILIMTTGAGILYFFFASQLMLALSIIFISSAALLVGLLLREFKLAFSDERHGDRSLMGEFKLKPGAEAFQAKQILGLATSLNLTSERLRESCRKLKQAETRLAKQRRKTEALKKAKQIFLVNISHEIRTPMNGVLGFARLLEGSIKDPDHQESLRLIIKSADQLMTILNDILDFSNLEEGNVKFNKQPFYLKDAVDGHFKLMAPEFKSKGLGFKYHFSEYVPEVISGDELRLGQVLLNLTSNALKFTDSGNVGIDISVVEETAEEVTLEFCVRDTGIGIALEKQQQIFDFFEQASNDASRRYAGTGLGLSIVKKLVSLQGGEVFLESKLGRGSNFYFRLPFETVRDVLLQHAVPASVTTNVHVEDIGRDIHVLIVEDNPINQRLVIKLMEARGYQTTVAEHGRIAVEELAARDYDIVLMDLQMPEMDGYEATKLIRKMAAPKKNTPIVAMTAHTIKGELEKCLSIGMNDYISKPFSAAELYQKVEALTVAHVVSEDVSKP